MLYFIVVTYFVLSDGRRGVVSVFHERVRAKVAAPPDNMNFNTRLQTRPSYPRQLGTDGTQGQAGRLMCDCVYTYSYTVHATAVQVPSCRSGSGCTQLYSPLVLPVRRVGPPVVSNEATYS
jgi:hypothetical protein